MTKIVLKFFGFSSSFLQRNILETVNFSLHYFIVKYSNY